MQTNQHIEVHQGAVLKLATTVMPDIKPNEVLVKVAFCGLCGSDIPRIFANGAHYYPITLGHEFSGVVVACGKAVRHIQPGNQISCAPLVPCLQCAECHEGYYSLCQHYSFIGSRLAGGNAQYVAVPEISCFVLPPPVSLLQGAFFEPLTVGLHPILMNGGCQNKNVIVIGAGTIGLLTLQAAKALGASSVTMIDISAQKLQLAAELGADYSINSSDEKQLTDWLSDRQQLIIELAGVAESFKLSLKIAGSRAQIYLVGTIHQDFNLAYKEYETILRKELTISGSWMNYSANYPGREWQVAAQLFSDNQVDCQPLIDGIYTPQQYIERVMALPERPLKGKVLLAWPE